MFLLLVTPVWSWLRRRRVRPRSGGGAATSPAALDALARQMFQAGYCGQDV